MKPALVFGGSLIAALMAASDSIFFLIPIILIGLAVFFMRRSK